ncbi:hypothetical protein ACF06Q_07770 [Streptomyces leeuwenhoekii]|uniref:hypothetical protein n=1 Tax=Streptomyces leeuwenhoekii TaxID=1437453 RepID=UPI0036FAA579
MSAARPVLVAPFMSENEANGRLFLEATGAGRCLWHSEVRDRRLMFVDSTGARHDRPPLTARALVAAVGPLLSDASYASAARRLSRELAACTRRQAETVTTAVRALV